MKPKEKAKELFDKYYKLAESIEWTDKQTSKKAEKMNDKLGQDVLFYWNELAKQSALIAVDLAIEESVLFEYGNPILLDKRLFYWQEVQQEIINL
jgi:pyridoxine/pyridoxamine 5'-phosphate oxidase